MSEWYYDLDGEQQGPVSKEVLQAKFVSAELPPSNLVWTKDMADWQPASEVEGLISIATPITPVLQSETLDSVPNSMLTGKMPRTYLVQSIILTALTFFCCCCIPLGVIPLVLMNGRGIAIVIGTCIIVVLVAWSIMAERSVLPSCMIYKSAGIHCPG